MRQFFKTLLGTDQHPDLAQPFYQYESRPPNPHTDFPTFSEIADDILFHGPARRQRQAREAEVRKSRPSTTTIDTADLFDISDHNEVVSCPKTDQAYAFLSQKLDLIEEYARLEEALLVTKNKHRSLNGEAVIDEKAARLKIIRDGKVAWKDALQTALKRYGEAAAANALFQTGDPKL